MSTSRRLIRCWSRRADVPSDRFVRVSQFRERIRIGARGGGIVVELPALGQLQLSREEAWELAEALDDIASSSE
jgi:hypothetical protein